MVATQDTSRPPPAYSASGQQTQINLTTEELRVNIFSLHFEFFGIQNQFDFKNSSIMNQSVRATRNSTKLRCSSNELQAKTRN